MVELSGVVVAPHTSRPVPAAGVLRLYRDQGWWPERTAEQVAAVLDTTPAVGAWRGAELVGFARAVTDGILRAYVEDIVVAAPLRGQGIGRALIDRLVEQVHPVPVVTLFCARDVVGFYESLGFRATNQTVLHVTRRS